MAFPALALLCTLLVLCSSPSTIAYSTLTWLYALTGCWLFLKKRKQAMQHYLWFGYLPNKTRVPLICHNQLFQEDSSKSQIIQGASCKSRGC